MILAIDIGNTNIVLGCIVGEKICFTARISTDKSKTEYQYAAEIKTLLDLYKMPSSAIIGCIISSVVPPVLDCIKEAVKIITEIEPIIVNSSIDVGFQILLDEPKQLGSDRIVNAAAALSIYEPPIIIIDMGTATTLCAIDGKKNYLGGAIIPGVNISLNALSSNTAQLPAINLEKPERAIGRNTIESMRSGVVLGAAAMLDGMIARFESELGEKATKIATGGLAGFIIPYCKEKIIYEKDLLLRGLNILYNIMTENN